MSNEKEMTAEEYLKVIEKYPLSLQAVHVEYYGNLRAKEAVKEFAKELMKHGHNPKQIRSIIINFAKQKGM